MWLNTNIPRQIQIKKTGAAKNIIFEGHKNAIWINNMCHCTVKYFLVIC